LPEHLIRTGDQPWKVSRGGFLKICGQILGAALLGPAVDARSLLSVASGPYVADAEQAPVRGRFRMTDACAAVFRAHLDTTFAVRSADGTRLRLVLARIIERPIEAGIEQFSLIFHAPAGTAVPDGTHAFHHPAFGGFDLFIVPIGGSNLRHTVYEACFSRHVIPCQHRS
jgi:hypothetical protein